MILWLSTHSTRRACKPRASGDDPGADHAVALVALVNPARAGMILNPSRRHIPRARKPRASGDDPAAGCVGA